MREEGKERDMEDASGGKRKCLVIVAITLNLNILSKIENSKHK